MNSPILSILICTHNRSELLARTLQSLREVDRPANAEVELIVVANACTDDTVAVVNGLIPTLPFATRCVEEAKPGLSVARNRALAESRGQIIAFLDDDIWAEKPWLVELLALYEKYPADFSGAKVKLWWDAVAEPAWFKNEYDWILSGCDRGDEVIEMDSPIGAIGANFAFRRAVYERLGGFNPSLGRVGKNLNGGEESEFLQRAIAAGFRGFYNPRSVVKHWVAPARVTPEYMSGVMAGNAEARIISKPAFGPTVAARALVGHAWLLLRHEAGLLLSQARGDSPAALRHRLYRAAGKGGLVAAWRRATTRSSG